MSALEDASDREDTKVAQIVEYLREQIESEKWSHGHKVPSQKDLAKQFGVSVETARNALGIVAEDGMINKSQGRRSYVNWPNPLHRLFISARSAALTEPETPSIEFSLGGGAEAVKREWTEDHVEVPKWVARAGTRRRGHHDQAQAETARWGRADPGFDVVPAGRRDRW